MLKLSNHMYKTFNLKKCCALKNVIFEYRKYWMFKPDIPVDENFIPKYKGYFI